jgi:acyl transferase domain-containing protein
MKDTLTTTYSGLEIAVIGMSGRFPGAENIAAYWDILKNGVETVTFFSEAELKKAGVSPDLIENPKYVKSASVLEKIEYFDAPFFGYTPKEAEILNPQIRLFYECVYEALEDGGYAADNQTCSIGLYGGGSTNYTWEMYTLLSGKSSELGSMAVGTLSHKDSLATRISYKLNLTGPAISVSTACSTSLVAIHLACRALLTKECDIALAGGVSLQNLEKKGYIYQEGSILTPDGHCQPFDARTRGSLLGDGAGVVLLKKFKNAVSDGDNIYAVIRGTALNNDGFRKVGYTAPSVDGQAEVIKAALKMAGAIPGSIGFIETHGTGTKLGDPIEVEALKTAFRGVGKKSCALGAVKSNFGHLEAAAGAAGFIKAVLALKHKLIPPTLHFETPNPEIDFENSPFYVNTKLSEWPGKENLRRAGVSSFGIGGTNAHAILEEWPGSEGETHENEAALNPREYRLILLSARSKTALERSTGNLAAHLENNPDLDFADVAYTLQTGRKTFRHRKILASRTAAEAARELTENSKKIKTYHAKPEKPTVIFILSGQGGQYVNMGEDLYHHEPFFRREMDDAFELVKPLLNLDLKEVLYPGGVTAAAGTDGTVPEQGDINRPEVALSINFIFEYALARLLMHLGVNPQAMTGYSLGEYAAACLSGVFSLAEALELVSTRGKLMQKTPAGTMLSVPLPEGEIRPLLEGSEVSLAIINGPSCVVAGSTDAVTAFDQQMREKRLLCAPINMFHAVHSPLMDPIRQEFEREMGKVKLKSPRIPYISNVSGTWVTAAQAVNPSYWGEHLCSPVRYSDGLKELLKIENALFVEVGPGRLLSNIIRQLVREGAPVEADRKIALPGQKIVNMVKHQQEKHPDDYYFLSKLGELWLYGVPVDWRALAGEEKRRRISLPTYPFEGKRYWLEIEALKTGLGAKGQQRDLGSPGAGAEQENNQGEPADNADPGEKTGEGYDYYEDNEDDREYEAPRDELERNIAQVWQNILGFARVGLHDNYYDMNGDSLTATQMVTRLQMVYPVEISLKAFLENPTVAHLAEIIRELLMEKIQGLSAEELDALAEQDLL